MSKSSLSLFTVHKWKFTMNAAGFETDKNKRGEVSKYTQRWCKGNARRHQLFSLNYKANKGNIVTSCTSCM